MNCHDYGQLKRRRRNFQLNSEFWTSYNFYAICFEEMEQRGWQDIFNNKMLRKASCEQSRYRQKILSEKKDIAR